MRTTRSDAKTTVLVEGDRRVVVTDSIAYASTEEAGQIVVTGSHGGSSAGEYARQIGVACIICSDAGFGKNDAGIVGLRELDADGIAGVAVAHHSARIGDGFDIWKRGVVTFVNETARAHGYHVGEPLREQVEASLRSQGEHLMAER